MTDVTDRLLDYAFDRLDAPDRAEAEAELLADPESAALLARLTLALRPLEAARALPPVPPPGLVAATLAYVAQETVRHREEFRDSEAARRPQPARGAAPPREWWLLDRRRIDVAVAAALSFVAFGLLLGGVGKLRERSALLACQDRLRTLHVALEGYSDTHGGRYPEVGTAAVPRAGDFAAELARGGRYDAVGAAGCPADRAEPASYAYTLGYHPTPFAPVTGVRRAGFASESGDFTPLVADLPTAAASPVRGPVSPHGRGQNVLFLGGAVRFTTVPTVGVRGDDIYRNDAGVVRAGLRSDDATLGRATDTP